MVVRRQLCFQTSLERVSQLISTNLYSIKDYVHVLSVCGALGKSTSAIAKVEFCFYCLKEVFAK